MAGDAFEETLAGFRRWAGTTERKLSGDPEDDAAYQDRLADRLLLQSTTLVTAADYQLMALEVSGVGRALAIGDQARKVTVALTDSAGEPVVQSVKDTVKEASVIDAVKEPPDAA